MKREYMDGYIETLYGDGGGAAGYFLPGHESIEDFISCLREDWKLDVEAEFVAHRYMRKVPDRVNRGWWTAALTDKPGRGALAVTYFDRVTQEYRRWERLREAEDALETIRIQAVGVGYEIAKRYFDDHSKNPG